ncbi:MAG TPA: DUF3592 domain-containing protein [Steroidobacteraceae bacterium]|nr:DUF3592 domain-containing protein [Steroidobacteraceae bacterium]
MFELLVSAIAAFNQLGLLIGALICGAIGAGLLGNALFWQIHAVRVQGRLIGVRQGQNTFRSVYRYTLPSGESCEGTSKEGSSSLKGRETGSMHTLLVMPEHTDEVEEASSHVWSFVGAIFLGTGVWMFHAAATVWPIGPLTWIAVAIFLLYSAFKIWRSVLPVEKRLGAADWRAMLNQRRVAEVAASPVVQSEQILATPERRANDAKQQQTLKRWAPMFILFGVLLLALSLFLGRNLIRLENAGLRSAGTVESLEATHSDNNTTYHPVVQFATARGDHVRFRDSVGSNPPSFHVGDQVTVLYLADDTHSAIIDRGPVNWLPPGLTLLFGALLCFGGVRGFRQAP